MKGIRNAGPILSDLSSARQQQRKAAYQTLREGHHVKKSSSSNATIRRSNSSRKPTSSWAANRRKLTFFISLVSVLGLTSLLLKAMARSPMQPDAADTLFAYGTGDSIDAIFHVQSPVQAGRWQYLYIHHSKTPGGNALTLGSEVEGLGDHFVIGNGDGLADGEVQISQRWNHQQSAVAPSGNIVVQSNCISICLVGDFDRKPPTPMQLGRLGQLVQALQMRCRIPASRVEWLTEPAAAPAGNDSATASAAGIGRLFPASAFHDQLRSWPAPTP
jgi:hypothetical protein